MAAGTEGESGTLADLSLDRAGLQRVDQQSERVDIRTGSWTVTPVAGPRSVKPRTGQGMLSDMTDAVPPELAGLRSRLEGLLLGYRAEVDHFSEDSVEGRSVVRGWGTRIQPFQSDAPPLSLWFDAFDRDLVLEIADFGWFEWRDLSRSEWQEEVVSVVSAVLAGRVTRKSSPWRTWCEVVLDDGAVRRASSGRPIQLRVPGTVRFPPYRFRG